MMASQLTLSVDGRKHRLGDGNDISIHLAPDSRQPEFFGAAPARSETLDVAGFYADTRAGASCNVNVLHLTPHCNGTHTECIGHISKRRESILDHAPRSFLLARLASVVPVRAADVDDTLPHFSEDDDFVIPEKALAGCLADMGRADALILRTLPNSPLKREKHYQSSSDYAYLTPSAMDTLSKLPCQHLLIDTPSLDRMDNRGELQNHRLVWGLEKDQSEASEARSPERTITEMIYVPDTLDDGWYLLNLQLPPLVTDAVPSRPVVFPLQELGSSD